jgi:uncharacterized SAM-binding protein YcdF (DUF218 family)
MSLLIGILFVTIGGALLLIRRLGPWLVVNDPLERADCILVLGGHPPFRAMEAAALYHQAWASEIWLTQFPRNREEAVLSSMGIDLTPEYVMNRRVLEYTNVPADRISLVDEPSNDTLTELSNTHRRFRQRYPGGTIILVTSRFHARRVKVIWRRIAGRSERACVRTAKDVSFTPGTWFTDKGDLSQVAHEVFGLLNVRMGNPLRVDRSRQADPQPQRRSGGPTHTLTTGAAAHHDASGHR